MDKVPGAEHKGSENVFLPASANSRHRGRARCHVHDERVLGKGLAARVDCACGVQGKALPCKDQAVVATYDVHREQVNVVPCCHVGEHGLVVRALANDVGRCPHVDDGVHAAGDEVEQGHVACAAHCPEGGVGVFLAQDYAEPPACEIDNA